MSMSVIVTSGISDSFFLSSFGFNGGGSFFALLSLGIVLVEEFSRAYVPVFHRGIAFFLLFLPSPFERVSMMDEECGTNSIGNDTKAPIVPEKYSTFQDDRKSKKGDENDIYMLLMHKYNKFRHTSKAFLLRNHLTTTNSRLMNKPES